MDETRRENVMSVELAIRRELAYRMKLASLQSLSDETMENLIPLQMPSPSSSKRPSLSPEPSSVSGSSMSLVPTSSYQVQAPSPSPGLMLKPTQLPSPRSGPSLSYHVSTSIPHLKLTTLPAPSLIPNPSSSARPWPSQISGPTLLVRPGPSQIPGTRSFLARPSLMAKPSMSGIKRKETSSNLQYRPAQWPHPPHNNYVTVDQEGNFYCKACQVPCSGAINLKQHLKGHKHKAKLQWLKMSKRDGRGNENPCLHCELCQIWCMNKDVLEMHMKGQKHQAKLQGVEFGSKRERETQQPWCELCQIWCMNEDAFHQHIKGKNHVTRLYAIEEQKRVNGEEVAEMEWAMV